VEQHWVVAIKIPGDGNMAVPSVAVGRAKQAETKNAKWEGGGKREVRFDEKQEISL
jgi:hypothetical protein